MSYQWLVIARLVVLAVSAMRDQASKPIIEMWAKTKRSRNRNWDLNSTMDVALRTRTAVRPSPSVRPRLRPPPRRASEGGLVRQAGLPHDLALPVRVDVLHRDLAQAGRLRQRGSI